jgi:hypothetical protein
MSRKIIVLSFSFLLIYGMLWYLLVSTNAELVTSKGQHIDAKADQNDWNVTLSELSLKNDTPNINFTNQDTYNALLQNYSQNEESGHGFTIRDPTYQEMLSFIYTDSTDARSYSDTYTCANFAKDVKKNALLEGYRCGFVYIEFPDSSHAVICFNTVDKGLIFIEPQDDSIVSLKVGQYSLTYDDMVVKILIIW